VLGPKLYDAHLDQAELEQQVMQTLQAVLQRDETPLTVTDRARVVQEVADEILGHGPLEPLGRRRTAFDEQLPNVLQLVAGSLQTGMSLSQALDAVVREDAQPASGEFARALGEARLGVNLDIALDGVADRLNSADLRWVIMTIRIQRETGGNLAEVLRNTVATMRERAYLRRQVRSLSAEGRLSAYVLLALPFVVAGWLLYSNPTYMHPLFSTVFGVLMLVISCVLVVIGALWMRRLINVEV